MLVEVDRVGRFHSYGSNPRGMAVLSGSDGGTLGGATLGGATLDGSCKLEESNFASLLQTAVKTEIARLLQGNKI